MIKKIGLYEYSPELIFINKNRAEPYWRLVILHYFNAVLI